MRFLYSVLSLFSLFSAASRGNAGKYIVRRSAHRAVSRWLR